MTQSLQFDFVKSTFLYLLYEILIFLITVHKALHILLIRFFFLACSYLFTYRTLYRLTFHSGHSLSYFSRTPCCKFLRPFAIFFHFPTFFHMFHFLIRFRFFHLMLFMIFYMSPFFIRSHSRFIRTRL